MKKVLLFAFTVFSMSGIAQHIGTMKPVEGFKPKAEPKFEMAKRIDFSQLKPSMQTKAVTEPEGTKTSYFLDYYDYAYEIGSYMRPHVASDIIIAENGKVYISNMFFTNDYMFGDNLYITGTLNGTKDSIIIDNNQLLGTINYNDGTECKYYICNLDTNSGNPLLSSCFKFAIDPQDGIIYSDKSLCLGLYENDGTKTTLYSYCSFMKYIPANLFVEPVTYDYNCYNYNNKNQDGIDYESTVDIIIMDFLVYIKGLFPYNHSNSWMIGEVVDNNIILYSGQIVDDDVAAIFRDEANYIDSVTLLYNNTDNSYSSPDGVYMSSHIYSAEKLYTIEICSDMVITPTPTAINTVEAGNKVVASTEYYDLSGRRIVLDDTTKGMCIKVVRYTDGTSNAIKMMR